MRTHKEIDTELQAEDLLSGGGVISRYAFQCINFRTLNVDLDKVTFQECIFIGCKLTINMRQTLDDSNIALTSMQKPYNVFSSKLYTAQSLYQGYVPSNPKTFEYCYDNVVYKHYLSTGKRAKDIVETLARTLHDHSMSDALHDFLDGYNEEDVVAVMGGHALLRSDAVYGDIVRISKILTENGKLMVSGGGPGAMEATHLGAWMAGRSNSDVDNAIAFLSQYPSFDNEKWLSSAFDIMARYPQSQYESIGIPTWLYGHEPATPFATRIAKYFENSLREDGLLTIAKGGVIYTPGSAGTMQEIFQDAVQNHYLTFGYSSPMVFLDKKYWTEELPAYALLEEMKQSGKYKNLILSISDNIDQTARSILNFVPPKKD